jgi:hypothetical protein
LLADLNTHERRLIEWLLPEDKPFYAGVRSSLETLDFERQLDGSIQFGRYDDDLAETVAIGEIEDPDSTVSLRMDEDGEGAFLSIPELSPDTRFVWTLSSWTPASYLARQIEMNDATGAMHYVFALSPARRVLWLHHVATGYNQLIPVTGLFVELARLRRVTSTGSLTHHSFFELADKSSDDVLMEALLEYNKRARKFDAGKVSLSQGDLRRTSGFNFFRKRS